MYSSRLKVRIATQEDCSNSSSSSNNIGYARSLCFRLYKDNEVLPLLLLPLLPLLQLLMQLLLLRSLLSLLLLPSR